MKTINMHDAKTHLSKLVDQAVAGEPFLIAKAGRPMVKVMAIGASTARKPKRIGFMAGEAVVPSQETFDALGADSIPALFGAEA